MKFRRAAVEIAIVGGLGTGLAAGSLGLMVAAYGVRIRFGDVFTLAVAGLVASGAIRGTILLHRRWKKTIGRFTAAVALCAIAALVGTAAVMVPSECPGDVFSDDRCGAREAAAWGQVAGLAFILNFVVIGGVLALYRGIRNVLRDGLDQGGVWIGLLHSMRGKSDDEAKPTRKAKPAAPAKKARTAEKAKNAKPAEPTATPEDEDDETAEPRRTPKRGKPAAHDEATESGATTAADEVAESGRAVKASRAAKKNKAARARDGRGAKGRPTPRRADAERDRRDRLRTVR